MENFKHLSGYGFKGFRNFKAMRQDKGHRVEIGAFVERIASSGTPLIPFEEIIKVTRVSFAAVESAKTNRTIQILR